MPLGADTETTFCGDKLQYDSCLDRKSHEESFRTSVVMKNKSKRREKLGGGQGGKKQCLTRPGS